jgi:hypothetical protein
MKFYLKNNPKTNNLNYLLFSFLIFNKIHTTRNRKNDKETFCSFSQQKEY